MSRKRKGLLIAAAAVLVGAAVLLSGCTIGLYSASPKEAYLEDPIEVSAGDALGGAVHVTVSCDQIDMEVDCISVTEDGCIWLAKSNDDYLVNCVMAVRNGQYSMMSSSLYELRELRDNPNGLTMSDVMFDETRMSGSNLSIFETVVPSGLASDRNPSYSYQDYSIPYEDGVVDCTLIYYTA